MKRRSSILKFQTSFSWFVDFFMIHIIFLAILFLAIYFDKISFNTFFKYAPIIFLAIYFFQQYVVKNFQLYDDRFLIKYPLSIMKDKLIPLNEVERFKFRSNNSAYDPNVLIVQMKDKKKSKFYFFGGKEFQNLIDLLRAQNFIVDVNSHIWK